MEDVSIILLILLSIIIMCKCIKKRDKFYIILAWSHILITICFMCYCIPSLEKTNFNTSINDEQKADFKNFISDLKFYNEYIHNIDNYELVGDCDSYYHEHIIQITYSEHLDEYDNGLVYDFSSLQQPDFVHYFLKYYNNFYIFEDSSFCLDSNYIYAGYDNIFIHIYCNKFDAEIIECSNLSHNNKDTTVSEILLTYINEEQPKDINKMITSIENSNFEPVISSEYSRYVDYRVYYIITICLLSIIITLNIANIILVIVVKKLHKVNNVSSLTKNEIQQISDKSKQNQAEFTILKWEDLSKEDKKPYIETAIKELFEQQIKNTSLNLSRQEIALKKMALDNKEFLEEDLKEEEKKQVLMVAKNKYEIRDKLTATDGKKKCWWAKLSKLSKAAILTPVILYSIAGILGIISKCLLASESGIEVGLKFMSISMALLIYGLIFIIPFESIAIGILLYRRSKKIRDDIIKKLKE